MFCAKLLCDLNQGSGKDRLKLTEFIPEHVARSGRSQPVLRLVCLIGLAQHRGPELLQPSPVEGTPGEVAADHLARRHVNAAQDLKHFR